MVHVQPFEDWRAPFIELLTHGRLLSALATPQEQNKIRQLSEPFVLDNKNFKRVSISGKIHECVAGDIIKEIISEAHKHEGTHFNLTTTWHYVLCTPYWWPTRRKDVLAYCQECPVCKIANKREMHDTFIPPDTKDHDELLPIEPLEVGENLMGETEPD